MRTIVIFSIVLIFSTGPVVCAQEYLEPQWRFHLAFEDATGARDTIWIILDTAATVYNIWVPPYSDGWDPQFGEIPVELDPNQFNVWLSYWQQPYYKTVALPLGYEIYVGIEANNYVLPITLSWDTALFRAPVLLQTLEGPINAPLLDNEYFFNYHASLGWASYCMLYDTQVEMPEFWWGSGNQFTLVCDLRRGWGNPLSGSDPLPQKPTLQLYPNPVTNWLQIESKESWVGYMVLNAQGQVVLQGLQNAVQPGVDVGSLPAGAYILRLLDGKGEKVAAGRFVKQ